MREISIQAIPNQTLSVVLDQILFDIYIRLLSNGIMTATIYANSELLIENTRVVPGIGIIPYRYLEQGNFALLTLNDDLPDYNQFGITQSLIYATEKELEALRGV